MPPERPAEDLPPGTTTLRRWAARHGRTFHYVRQFWRRRDGFPDPVGALPSRARHGGGPGEHLYDEASLDTWLETQADLLPPPRITPAIAPDERITLGRFAALIGKDRKTVTQHRGRPGFPEPDATGAYRAGELFEYWNSRSGYRGSARPRG